MTEAETTPARPVRERRAAEHFSSDEPAEKPPLFDFALGKGAALATLWVNRPKRDTALEGQLEPLHRLLMNRPGRAGERRAALLEFKGVPQELMAKVKAKVETWTKDNLDDTVAALGIKSRKNKPEMLAAVLAFLEHPSASLAVPAAASPQPPSKKKASSEPVAPAPKRPRKESTSAASEPPKVAPPEVALPAGNALREEIEKRLKAMSAAEREALPLKALRTALEEHFALPAGALKAVLSDAVADVMSQIV